MVCWLIWIWFGCDLFGLVVLLLCCLIGAWLLAWLGLGVWYVTGGFVGCCYCLLLRSCRFGLVLFGCVFCLGTLFMLCGVAGYVLWLLVTSRWLVCVVVNIVDMVFFGDVGTRLVH